jgi:hypothetical protein
MVAYTLIIKPFKLAVKNIEVGIYEGVLFIVNVLAFAIARMDDPENSNVIFLGKVVLWIEFAIKITTIVFTVVELGFVIRDAIRKLILKRKIARVTALENAEEIKLKE